ncbi:MAG: hypothetical protein U0P81_00395 [Holophagaceae bacterium]
MHAPTLLLALLLAPGPGAGPQEIPEVEGKSLASVPGPFTDRYPDPARDPTYRGLDVQIRRQSRRTASIPAVAVPSVPLAVKDRIADPAGWRAYRVEVPGKAVVHARLRSDHEAWFLVRTVNKWGQLTEGMLQNLIPTGNPEATYKNPKDEAAEVYFVVDTRDLGAQGEPFTLTFTRK